MTSHLMQKPSSAYIKVTQNSQDWKSPKMKKMKKEQKVLLAVQQKVIAFPPVLEWL